MPVKTKGGIQTQKISIDFGLGVDEFTDRKLVKEGKLLKAENISFTKAKTIAKRNGFSPLSNLDISGEIIQEPKKICSFREKPVVFSEEKVYNKIDTEYQSNAVAWRDSKNFHFPTHVNTDGIMQLPPSGVTQTASSFSLGSAIIDTKNVKCTVVGSRVSFGLDILVEDYENNEVLHSSKIGGEHDPNRFLVGSVKVIPFKSFGGDPDRFIIFYQEAAWEYDVLKPTIKTSFRVATVRLNSMTEVSVTEEGDMFNYFSMSPYNVFTKYLGSFGGAVYAYDFDVLYDEENAHIFFVFCAQYNGSDPFTGGRQRMVFFRVEQAVGTTDFLGRYIAFHDWPSPELILPLPWWDFRSHFKVSLIKKIFTAPEPKLGCAIYNNYDPSGGTNNSPLVQIYEIDSVPPDIPPNQPPSVADNKTIKYGDGLDTISSDTFPSDYRCTEIKYHEPNITIYGGKEKKHLFLSFMDMEPSYNPPDPDDDPTIFSGPEAYTSYSYIDDIDFIAGTAITTDIDILPFTKIAASPIDFSYGGDDPNVTNDYLLIPVYKKRNLLQYEGDRFGDIYILSYNVGVGKVSIDASEIEGHCIAKTLSGSAYGSFKDPTMTPEAFLSKGNMIFDSISYASTSEISASRCIIGLGTNFEAVEMGDSLYTSGGFLKVFNGRSYVENNFHFPPIVESIEFGSSFEHGFYDFKKTLANTNGTGEIIFDNVESSEHPSYEFIFCYEWTDENGTLHRSAPSEIIFGRMQEDVEIRGGSSPGDAYIKFKINGFPLTLTEKSNAVLKAYRTLNLTGERSPGTPGEFFLDGVSDVETISTSEIVTTASLTVVHQFNKKDTSIGMNDTIYTSKGELANIPPPPAQDIGIHDGRLFALSSENPNRIFYSKPNIQKTSLEFSDELYLNSMEKGGDIRAIGSIMGKLFMFKENLIAVSYGSPKNEKGENGGYSASSTYTHTMGCSNPRSVISTGNGLYFQFGGDLYMIDRSLQVKWVGAPVDDSDDVDIIAAIHVGDSDEIRFMSREHTLVFNVLFKQWSKFTNRAVSAALVRGVLHYINIGGELSEVLYEDKSSYGDSDVPVLTDIETAWINLAGPQGFQRLRNILFLGELYQDTTFDIQLFYDYNRYPSETITVNASDIASLEVFGGEVTWGAPTPDGYAYFGGTNLDHIFQFRLKPKIQKCESIKIKIVEPPRLSVTKGYALNNMTLEIASKKSAYKLKESKTI
jgi:hypothetical protein